jgi:hypothetical protein
MKVNRWKQIASIAALTVMLLEKIGQGVEVHHIDPELVLKSVNLLQEFQTSHCLDL